MDFYDVAINYPLYMLEAFTFCIPLFLVCAVIFYSMGWKDGKRFKEKEDNWRKAKGDEN